MLLRYRIFVGRYRSIWVQVFRFWYWYWYLYMSAGVVADICAMARPIQRPRITGKGVCSNSIECATNTSKKFALAWQLDSLGLWCSFCWRCTSAHFAFQPAATTRCDCATGSRVRKLVAMMIASILCPALRGSARFATLSCYRINANEWWWWWQTYMRHLGNDLRLTGHSWRRPVTAETG